MNANALIGRLEGMSGVLPALLRPITPEDARWRPDPGDWSILEVVRHLADEETEDFRRRLCLTLDDPREAWPKIDPEAVAAERRYNEGSLPPAIEAFESARAESVAWLRGLSSPDWTRTHHHPSGIDVPAGELLTAWVAHDALHLRQLSKRLFQLGSRDGAPHPTRYAGVWPEELAR